VSGQRVQVQGDLFHGVVPEGAVYVGRAAPGLPASPYANPFPVKTYGLDESLRCYALFLDGYPNLVERAVEEIGDSDMACWCKPGARCHGDLLRAAMDAARAKRED
jgi:hypothetical protein